MSVSMNPIHSTVINTEEMKTMNFLGLQINNIYKSTDKTMQITELAKELLGSKKETSQETEAGLLAGKYSSFIKGQPLKLFAMSLHRLPANPLEVGLEYIRKAPGYDLARGFQVPNDWERSGTVTLNQIYKEQFFAWILKNNKLPFSSILLMLHILKSFDDPSIPLDKQIWDKFLLTEKRQKQFKEFQSKYEFLMNNKFLQSFPIELEKITINPNIQQSICHQYGLFEEIFKWIVEQFLEGVQISNTGQTLKNALEDLPARNLPKKVLAYKLKKLLPLLQQKFTPLLEYVKSQKTRLKELEESLVEVDIVLTICKERKEQISSQNAQAKGRKKRGQHKGEEFNIQNIMKGLLEEHKQLELQGVDKLERDARFNQQLHKILKEQMTTSKHVQETEDFFIHQRTSIETNKQAIQKELSSNTHLLKEDFSRIHFLISHMDASINRERARWKGERLNLSIDQFDERLEKELLAESKITPSKTPQKSLDFSDEEEPIPSEEEEESVTLFEQPTGSPTHAPKLYTGEQMQAYLNSKAKNKQLNGALSQSVEILLQQMQPHLHRKQGREIYDHALLGAAALEQMAQAIHEGRIDHVVLGFRSGLIHCHFAVEQALSQEIFQETKVVADSHNLTFLANTLAANTQESFSEEDKKFLEEIRVHLWFHYPEDYRLYFAHNSAAPKAFSLLETLSQPGISKENVQEAMEFAFEKYGQTLEFVTKLLRAPTQDAVELFKSNLRDLQKHLNVGAVKPRKFPDNKSSLTLKMDRVLEKLASLDQLIHIKDLEDGWLLAIFDSIKSYLQFMKASLEVPQQANKHSLQKFIQVETLLNMEKLFKNLFRAVSFLHLGEDTRMHNLSRFYAGIQEFYKKPLSKTDRDLLRSINLSTAHHYFHKKSHADLKNTYSLFLNNARALSSVDEGFSKVATKSGRASIGDLQKKMEENGQIMQAMKDSLELFKKLLDPVIGEMRKINNDIEKECNRLQIG